MEDFGHQIKNYVNHMNNQKLIKLLKEQQKNLIIIGKLIYYGEEKKELPEMKRK